MVRWCVALTAIGIIIALCYGGVYGDKGSGRKAKEKRPDIVIVNSSESKFRKERPPVNFYHDLHTEALSGMKNPGCATCHKPVDGKFSTRFIPNGINDPKTRMNAYHERCVGCHKSYMAEHKSAGPVVCSGCHVERPEVESSAVSARFDRSLHQRHTLSLNKSCESCHHQYDAQKKKLYYEKGKEGSCTYCHPEKENGKDMSLKKASHLSCIVCHETRKEKGQQAGPVKCEGCHDPDSRKNIKKAENITRFEMGQKDFMVLKNEKDPKGESKKNRLNFVPFDHKNHEMKNESCNICHHKALTACVNCHTVDGIEKGGYVRLEKVMHSLDSKRSCTGCHERKRKTPECLGCHSFDVNWMKDQRKNCDQCHVISDIKGNEAAYASELILSNIRQKEAFDDKIPERIMISKLSNKYEPVNFPHRKIVKALYTKINGNRMALYFHREKTTLCMGCHHNSPATDKPTSCSTCHSITEKKTDLNKPALLGAYHIQCMECHAKMGIRQKESCTGCHIEKKQ